MAQNDSTATATKGVPVTSNKAAADKTTPDTNTKPAAAESANADRGDVGVVTIRKSTRDITNVRTRTTNDPIHLAVRDAVRGEWYDIEVDNDQAKIERVNRKLRAAAQKFDVGMNIHPDHPESENKGKVLVTFRTGERDKRAKTETDTKTTGTADTNAKPSEGKANA